MAKKNSKKETSNKSKEKLKESKLLKEMPGEEKFQGISKINRFNILFVNLQMIFAVFSLICLVWSFFNDKVYHVLQFVFSITLFICGYNNKIIYDRPKFAYVYYIVGAVILIVEILSLVLGV